ncbi:MAG: hypothetical protein ABWX92_03725 [Mycetocola sp.]
MRLPHHTSAFRRTARALALALVATVVLSGCFGFGPRSGDKDASNVEPRTSATVVAELQNVPGVLGAFVSTGPVGLPSQMELTIGLDLEADYPADMATLLDYTLAMAWSANREQPTTTAAVGFRAGDAAVDLAPVATELGWPGKEGPTLDLSMDEMAGRYGPWPGPVPVRPAGLS